jgi:hypothetical protein
VVMDFETMIGNDLAQGLDKLKQVLEMPIREEDISPEILEPEEFESLEQQAPVLELKAAS